jgi:hypothetical protein
MGQQHNFNDVTMKIQSMVKKVLGVHEIKGLIKYSLIPDISQNDQNNTQRNASRPQPPKTPIANNKPDISISGMSHRSYHNRVEINMRQVIRCD